MPVPQEFGGGMDGVERLVFLIGLMEGMAAYSSSK